MIQHRLKKLLRHTLDKHESFQQSFIKAHPYAPSLIPSAFQGQMHYQLTNVKLTQLLKERDSALCDMHKIGCADTNLA